MRLPLHIGVIPDGNRRWAVSQGMTKEKGYAPGLTPGLMLFKLCEQALSGRGTDVCPNVNPKIVTFVIFSTFLFNFDTVPNGWD